jgi:Ser/Thr protein kinase RdoA (MazF antagonist)
VCFHYQQRKPFAERYASVGSNQPRTHRFDRYIYRLAKRMAHTKVVKELAHCHTPISDNTVGRIYHRLARQELVGYEPGQPTRPDEQHVYAYGQSAATFHLATRDFSPSFAAGLLDHKQLLDEPLVLIRPFFADQPTEWTYLEALARKLRHHIQSLAAQGLEMGVCHNDLHGANAHIDSQDRVTFFEIEECRPGYYAYELAVLRWSEKTNTQLTTLFPAYIKGYTERRPLKEIDLAALPLFVAARHLWWLAGQIKIAPIAGYGRLHAPDFFQRAINFLNDWERSELTAYRL